MSAPETVLQPTALAALRQFAKKRRNAERCEMCSLELGPNHQHLIEPHERKLMCSCDACALLFTTQEGTKLRRIPRDARYLPDFRMSDTQWATLMIPIELVFFSFSSPHGRIVALYPSPAGATESLLSLDLWTDIERENPFLKEMTPDVEALLVNRVGATRGVAPSYFIAPIDECYKLVGVLRTHWHGLSGGTQMWGEIDKFFSQLQEKSTVVGGVSHA
jgi:hypothetical protein